jgi:hypothetical protein
MSRLESIGSLAADLERIESVKDMINSSIGFIIKNESVDYDIHYDEDLMNVRIVKTDFQTVVTNLINNAQEALNESGSISVSATNIHIGTNDILISPVLKRLLLDPGWYVKITIHDNGPGINGVILEKAFDPFFSTKRGHRGLGLSEAYSIIKRRGGAIFFEPEINEGCAVSFFTPSTDTSSDEQLLFSKSDLYSDENSPLRGKLLLIEKDSAIRKQISRVLKSAGFTIFDTDDLNIGITHFGESIASIPFDSIICDVDCLNNNVFYQFLSKTRITNQQLKTIGIKKHDSSNCDNRIFTTFFSTIIHSPVEIKVLLKAVRSAFSYK